MKGSKASFLRKRLGFEGCIVVDPIGLSGGLILLWKREGSVEIINYSQRHINAWCIEESEDTKWLFTRFYGNPETCKRRGSWDLLASFKLEGDTRWCVVGDFIETIC